MAKTVGLVVAAILLGVVMLNLVDEGGTSKAVPTSTTAKPVATSTTAGGDTSTTVAATGGKKPAELRVIVLNASGVSGVAKRVSTELRNQGYVNQQAAGTAGTQRAGSTVACKPGLDAEAAALVKKVTGKPTVVAWPATLPKMSSGTVGADVECIVVIGRTA